MFSNRPKIKTKRDTKLTWPGLRADDLLSRVVTRWVKRQREDEAWARKQIAKLLARVPPETVMKLLYREARHRKEPIPPSPVYLASRVL